MIEKADRYVKRLVPNAVYQEICNDYTIAYYQAEPKNDGHDKIINGINYRTVYTNKHDELINFYGSKQQYSIFWKIKIFLFIKNILYFMIKYDNIMV